MSDGEAEGEEDLHISLCGPGVAQGSVPEEECVLDKGALLGDAERWARL